MALTKIKLANKKAKHERSRRNKQKLIKAQARRNKVVQKRMKKFMAEGRKERKAKRRAELAYVKELEGEINNEL